MKCPYCAEEIKDEAILCRFCGAVKTNTGWNPPASPATAPPSGAPPAQKSNFTIRTAAVFFLVSALLEATSLTTKVPLFGAVRGGVVAAGYHLIYIGLFAAMGIGLWAAKSWGYTAMLAGTVFYTVDKVLFLLDGQAKEAYLSQSLQAYGGLLDVLDQGSIILTLNVSDLLFIACWWGFMLYLHYHRGYFESPG